MKILMKDIFCITVQEFYDCTWLIEFCLPNYVTWQHAVSIVDLSITVNAWCMFGC